MRLPQEEHFSVNAAGRVWPIDGNSLYFITSEKNGLSLFFAAAGSYYNGSLYDEGDGGFPVRPVQNK